MNQASINRFREHLAKLPSQLRKDTAAIFDDLHPQLPEPSANTPDWVRALPAVLCCSPFIVSLIRRDPAYLNELIESGSLFLPLDISNLQGGISASLAATDDEQEILQHLRYARNQAMLQIAFRDLAGWAPLTEVMTSLSKAAQTFASVTQDCTYRLTESRYGSPLAADSKTHQQLTILGMGKLGGGELNFSSDIDVIFCFPENGQTSARRPLLNQEFFSRQAKLFIKFLSSTTADGFVYRVDTRLRPNGDSGPLCLSFSAMENYYQLHGRDWERYAFIKASVIGGNRKKGQLLLDRLRPFIYRKYLDFSAIEAIRDMKQLIERQMQRKNEMLTNIKLGRGGIREVEFIAQAHQLIRGGRDPQLRQQNLLRTLGRLLDTGLMTKQGHACLTNGYEFLRRCENRLQMYADQQTHRLPEEPQQQLILAYAMGFTDWAAFRNTLRQHMQAIHLIFHELFISTADPQDHSPAQRMSQLWGGEFDDETACRVLADSHVSSPESLLRRLQAFRNGSLYRSLSNSARKRLDRLLPVMLHEVVQYSEQSGSIAIDIDETIIRCLELLAAIVRRPVYLSLLLDNDAVRQQLLRLLAASPYASMLIKRYPVLLDDLLSGYITEDFSLKNLSSALEKSLQSTPDDDLEQQMNLLREFNHSKLLAVASLHTGHQLSACDTGRHLSAIAEACIVKSLKLSIQGIQARHGKLAGEANDSVPFCVIAYGKLGSRELGFGSDLDLVFISDKLADSAQTDGPRKIFAAQYFARIGQRLVHILSTHTAAGRVYEIDMRLRPNGESGPLVASIRRLQRYQQEKAWTWEHQALVRARVIAGDRQLALAFDQLRKQILCRSRDDKKLRFDIVDMREKMRQQKNTPVSGKFDLKQGSGGIVDIEFMVQYMVLRWAHEYPQLTQHTETIALLDSLNELQLLTPETHSMLRLAYSNWLEKSYRLRLNQRSAEIPAEAAERQSRQVTEIWHKLLLIKQ